MSLLAEKIRSLEFVLKCTDGSEYAFTFDLKPRYTSEPALQFALCKASGICKVILGGAQHLAAVRLAPLAAEVNFPEIVRRPSVRLTGKQSL